MEILDIFLLFFLRPKIFLSFLVKMLGKASKKVPECIPGKHPRAPGKKGKKQAPHHNPAKKNSPETKAINQYFIEHNYKKRGNSAPVQRIYLSVC